jgi:hypothetical protein
MERLHAPNEFFRIRGLREGMRAWEELRRLLVRILRRAQGLHRYPVAGIDRRGCSDGI